MITRPGTLEFAKYVIVPDAAIESDQPKTPSKKEQGWMQVTTCISEGREKNFFLTSSLIG
jgi:hypothetical protein